MSEIQLRGHKTSVQTPFLPLLALAGKKNALVAQALPGNLGRGLSALSFLCSGLV